MQRTPLRAATDAGRLPERTRHKWRPPNMAHQWFVKSGRKEHGPFLSSQLKKLAEQGRITPETSVRRGEVGNWVPASKIKGLFPDTRSGLPHVEITKNIFGTLRVGYDCPNCKERLRSPLSDAGNPDSCPNCHVRFTVPGTDALKREKQRQHAELERKQVQAKRKAEQLEQQREQKRQQRVQLAEAIRIANEQRRQREQEKAATIPPPIENFAPTPTSINTTSSSYRSSFRRRPRPKDSTPLIVLGLVVGVVVGGGIVALLLLNRSGTHISAGNSSAQDRSRSTQRADTQSESKSPIATDATDLARAESAKMEAEAAAKKARALQEEITRKTHEELNRQRREEERNAADRAERRKSILAKLDALPAAESRERRILLDRIKACKDRILDVEQYLPILRRDIQGLELDNMLGQAFGTGQSGHFGTPRSQVKQLKLQQYRYYETYLSNTKALLKRTESALEALRVRYEKERNKLLAELASGKS